MDAYKTAMGGRFRTMCSHIVKTRVRHPKCAWLTQIFGPGGTSVGSKRPAVAVENDPDAAEEDSEETAPEEPSFPENHSVIFASEKKSGQCFYRLRSLTPQKE